MALHVDIVTPERAAFTGEADEVRIPGWEGEFGVLPGHDILLSLLRGGVTTLTSGGRTERFVTGRGFVEAGPDRVTVLTESCVPAERVDKAAAQAKLQQATETLAHHDADSPEAAAAVEQAELARAALEV